MSTTEQAMTTFEPDWDALTRSAWHVGDRAPNNSATKHVVAAYLSQMEAAGFIVVRQSAWIRPQVREVLMAMDQLNAENFALTVRIIEAMQPPS